MDSDPVRRARPVAMSFARDAIVLLAVAGISGWIGNRAARGLWKDLSRAERWAWSFWLGLVLDVLIYLVCLVLHASAGPTIMVFGLGIITVLSLLSGSR